MHRGGIGSAAAPRTLVAPGRLTPASTAASALAAVLALLLALPCLTATTSWPVVADLASPMLVGGTGTGLQVAVLPARDRTGGEVSTDRPDPTATAFDALSALPLTGGASRWHAPRSPAPDTTRPHHGAAGAPRAPPTPPPHS
jgi:hypothetical protein